MVGSNFFELAEVDLAISSGVTGLHHVTNNTSITKYELCCYLKNTPTKRL